MLRGLVRDELYLEALDPRALDLEHLEADRLVLDLVARLRGAAEHPEHEATNRVEVLDRQRVAELLVEVVDRERAVDEQAPVVQPLDGLVRKVELVLDLPDDARDLRGSSNPPASAPTCSSSRSSSVTSPSSSPSSSTTIARCWFVHRNPVSS